ncbi:MAG: NUDIX domain-containing protein [Patescibacteria group bacterium]
MEVLDIVDENDIIVGSGSKNDIYEKKLTHRIANVFIFNNENKLALQLRSQNVHFCPRHWSISASGHVQSGETYEEGALRELKEEIGLECKLELARKDFYLTPDGIGKFLTSFTAKSDGPFIIDSEVVDSVKFFSNQEIKKMIAAGEKFHPELLFILDRIKDITLICA